MSRSTWQYRRNPRAHTTPPKPQAQRNYPNRIDDRARERIEELILKGWADENSVDHSYAVAWDQGEMLASRRTWWRIAKDLEEQTLRPKIPTKEHKKTPREAPVVTATGPGQAWSWDITDLLTPWRGVAFKAYKITDIYSREIVGYRVEEREADHLAVDMFAEAIARHGVPDVVHADSGPAMRSTTLRSYLEDHEIQLSHNRPYVSNDNPFSEAGFRTMKYRPGYPVVFSGIESARDHVDRYVDWYNNEHKHAGIALFSPAEVGDGSWEGLWEHRNAVLQRYYEEHPERFRQRPSTPLPAHKVGINLPNTNSVRART